MLGIKLFVLVRMSFGAILNVDFFITFSSTVSSLHARVDSLEKSNTKLIEEVSFLSNVKYYFLTSGE